MEWIQIFIQDKTLAETYPEDYTTYSILYEPYIQTLLKGRSMNQFDTYMLEHMKWEEQVSYSYAKRHIDDSEGGWVEAEIHAENIRILDDLLEELPWERAMKRVAVFKDELLTRR